MCSLIVNPEHSIADYCKILNQAAKENKKNLALNTAKQVEKLNLTTHFQICNSLIKVYSKFNKIDCIFNIYLKMIQSNWVNSNNISVIKNIIIVCHKNKEDERFLTFFIKNDTDPYRREKAIKYFISENQVNAAFNVYMNMEEKKQKIDISIITDLIISLIDKDESDKAWEIMSRISTKAFIVYDIRRYSNIVLAFLNKGSINEAVGLLFSNPFITEEVYLKLIPTCLENNMLSKAIYFFKRIPSRYSEERNFLLNSLLKYLIENNQVDVALSFMKGADKCFTLDDWNYEKIKQKILYFDAKLEEFKTFSLGNNFSRLIEVFKELHETGFIPEMKIYIQLFYASTKTCRVIDAMATCEEIQTKYHPHYEPNEHVKNKIIELRRVLKKICRPAKIKSMFSSEMKDKHADLETKEMDKNNEEYHLLVSSCTTLGYIYHLEQSINSFK